MLIDSDKQTFFKSTTVRCCLAVEHVQIELCPIGGRSTDIGTCRIGNITPRFFMFQGSTHPTAIITYKAWAQHFPNRPVNACPYKMICAAIPISPNNLLVRAPGQRWLPTSSKRLPSHGSQYRSQRCTSVPRPVHYLVCFYTLRICH